MVATEHRKKIRTTDPATGKFRWVDPAEVEQGNARARAIADLAAGQLLDWDGNEVDDLGDYDEYVNSRPSKEALRRYPTPVFYAEVRYPGCALQPVPRMAAITSTPTGLWQANNAVQEKAIREHIAISTAQAGHPAHPDELKIDEEELAILRGGGGDIQYCQNAGCFFVSASSRAAKLHALTNGHRLDYRPRNPQES